MGPLFLLFGLAAITFSIQSRSLGSPTPPPRCKLDNYVFNCIRHQLRTGTYKFWSLNSGCPQQGDQLIGQSPITQGKVIVSGLFKDGSIIAGTVNDDLHPECMGNITVDDSPFWGGREVQCNVKILTKKQIEDQCGKKGVTTSTIAPTPSPLVVTGGIYSPTSETQTTATSGNTQIPDTTPITPTNDMLQKQPVENSLDENNTSPDADKRTLIIVASILGFILLVAVLLAPGYMVWQRWLKARPLSPLPGGPPQAQARDQEGAPIGIPTGANDPGGGEDGTCPKAKKHRVLHFIFKIMCSVHKNSSSLEILSVIHMPTSMMIIRFIYVYIDDSSSSTGHNESVGSEGLRTEDSSLSDDEAGNSEGSPPTQESGHGEEDIPLPTQAAQSGEIKGDLVEGNGHFQRRPRDMLRGQLLPHDSSAFNSSTDDHELKARVETSV